jgi:hypothetical protein
MVGSSCFFTNKVKDLLENNHYLSFGGKKWRIAIKTKARTRTDRVGELFCSLPCWLLLLLWAYIL